MSPNIEEGGMTRKASSVSGNTLRPCNHVFRDTWRDVCSSGDDFIITNYTHTHARAPALLRPPALFNCIQRTCEPEDRRVGDASGRFRKAIAGRDPRAGRSAGVT
jgi:hypothetical protein